MPRLALAAAFAPAAHAQNLITNGGFDGFGGCVNCNSGGSYFGTTQQLDGKLSNGTTAGLLTGWTTTSGYSFILTASQAISGFTGPYTTTALEM